MMTGIAGDLEIERMLADRMAAGPLLIKLRGIIAVIMFHKMIARDTISTINKRVNNNIILNNIISHLNGAGSMELHEQAEGVIRPETASIFHYDVNFDQCVVNL